MKPRAAHLAFLKNGVVDILRSVENQKELMQLGKTTVYIQPEACSLAIEEAIKEIEWLRAKVERLREALRWYEAEIERLKQEPELLRADLISLCNASRKALSEAYNRARITAPKEDGR